MSTAQVRSFLEQAFDRHPGLYGQIASLMQTHRVRRPDLNNKQTYHVKREFKLGIAAVQKNDTHGLIANGEIAACDERDFAADTFGLSGRLPISDVDNVRGMRIEILGYNYLVVVLQDKSGGLHLGKVIPG